MREGETKGKTQGRKGRKSSGELQEAVNNKTCVTHYPHKSTLKEYIKSEETIRMTGNKTSF